MSLRICLIYLSFCLSICLSVCLSSYRKGFLFRVFWDDGADEDLGWHRHAGRNTVAVDDVLMLARRNEGLERILWAFGDMLWAGTGMGGEKER